MTVCMGDSNVSIDPGFVYIKYTAVFTKDFEHQVPPVKLFAGLAGTGYPAKRDKFTGCLLALFKVALITDG